MHADEVRATPELVRRLVAEQCPQWAALPVAVLPGDVEGTDNVLFRLGEELVVRMPKVGWAAGQAESDARWLPRLAPHLPAMVPVPAHVGEASTDYPWRWSVVPWVEGTTPPRMGSDDVSLARDLAAFTLALQSLDPDGGPTKPPGSRGTPLRHVDPDVREALEDLRAHDDGLDLDAAGRAWEACLAAPEWDRAPVWIHGDLQPGNLVVGHRAGHDPGRLTGVIDWGAIGVGDPAPDLAPALWTFTGRAREVYREAVAPDDATWLRACGWALAPSLTGIGYYRHTFPRMAEHGRRMVRAVVAELA
ncbi:aminoglycoside phosphotransferase family protein [Terrabacter sp. NPDC080008]|uniref:aminoglycoside phosphotransferase family protein n=1 Tax=Terrabacter sp. NPDC080008 TaxID=3155176 RepID=UPI00344EB518